MTTRRFAGLLSGIAVVVALAAACTPSGGDPPVTLTPQPMWRADAAYWRRETVTAGIADAQHTASAVAWQPTGTAIAVREAATATARVEATAATATAWAATAVPRMTATQAAWERDYGPTVTALAARVPRPFDGAMDRVPLDRCASLLVSGVHGSVVYDCWEGELGERPLRVSAETHGHVVVWYDGSVTYTGNGIGPIPRVLIVGFASAHVCYSWQGGRNWGAVHMPRGHREDGEGRDDICRPLPSNGPFFRIPEWGGYARGLAHDTYPILNRTPTAAPTLSR